MKNNDGFVVELKQKIELMFCSIDPHNNCKGRKWTKVVNK